MEMHIILKNIVIGVSCFFVFCKFLEIKKWNLSIIFSSAVMVVLITFHNTLINFEFYELYTGVGILVLINMLIYRPLKLRFANSLTFLMISYAFGILLYLVSTTIVSSISAFILSEIEVYYTAYVITLFHLIISTLFYRIRFKFLIKNVKNFRGVCFSVFGMMLNIYSLMRITQYQDNGFMFMVSLGFMSYGLFTIIKRETVQAYSDTAMDYKLNEISSSFNDLMQTHNFLSDRVHKDSKYLKAFYRAVWIMLQESPDDETRAKAQRILEDISEYRNALQIEKQRHFDEATYSLSGMVLLDSIFLSMLEQAQQKGIDLTINFEEQPHHITNYISQEQFSTLIADLLENAMIAVDRSMHLKKDISCVIGKDEDTGAYQIVVKDSGNAFDETVLHSIGKRKITTRKESGGSGIGLWNVYKTMKHSKASLIINEFRNDNDFTKEIIFRFDGRCEYCYQGKS